LFAGIAFPTAISPNNAVAHLSPIEGEPEADTTLKPGDVLKISLGAHIDGFAGILADTIVLPEKQGAEEEITGRKADVLMAAWLASEAAIRLVKPGNKNFAVTDAVAKVADAFGCKPLQGTNPQQVCGGVVADGAGMLSHQQSRNNVMGKKTIILNPTTEQKNGTDVITFAEGVSHTPQFAKFRVDYLFRLGNIFVGYPCIYRNRPCPTNDIPHNHLLENGIDLSPQTQEFPRPIH
jgi:methionine aminopeptidase